MKDEKIDISVIIPAKDEEVRLPKLLEKFAIYAKASSKSFEVIIVDDGSMDETSQRARGFENMFNYFKVIRFEENQGKGAAVTAGLLEARGAIALFMDADGSTSLNEIEDNLHYFDEGYDVVVGSRVLQDDEHVLKAQFHRKIIGKVFNFLVQTILFCEIKDTQCGFKMFRRETIHPIFSRMNIKGFGFDLELIYLASKLGYGIKETPVNWSSVDGSKVNLVVDSLKMFINIFQVRSWHSELVNVQQKSVHVEKQ